MWGMERFAERVVELAAASGVSRPRTVDEMEGEIEVMTSWLPERRALPPWTSRPAGVVIR